MLPRITRFSEAREESLEDGEEPTKEAAKVIPPKEKNIVSEAGSSQTVGREQAMTEVHEIRKRRGSSVKSQLLSLFSPVDAGIGNSN